MNAVKDITLQNNEEIFKLKNQIASLEAQNNNANNFIFNVQEDANMLKYIHGEAFSIKGERAKQKITSVYPGPQWVPPTNLTNTITYTSNFAILPFNVILQEDNYHYTLTNIVFDAPIGIDSILIMYFVPKQYSFRKNELAIKANKQITFIDLRTSPVTKNVTIDNSFLVNRNGIEGGFDYDFTKLVLWMKPDNTAMCFISDIVKQN